MQFRNLKIVDHIVFGRGSFNQLDEIIPENIPQILFMKNKNKLWFDNILNNTKIDFVTNNINCIKNKCANEFQRHFEKKFYLLSPFEPNREPNKNIPTDVPICFIIKEAYKLYKLCNYFYSFD